MYHQNTPLKRFSKTSSGQSGSSGRDGRVVTTRIAGNLLKPADRVSPLAWPEVDIQGE